MFNGGGGNDATGIDANTGKIVGSVPLGGKPETAQRTERAASTSTMRIRNTIIAFDSRELKILNTWLIDPCNSPSGLAIDIAHKRLFAGCHNKIMTVVDYTNGKVVATVPIGEGNHFQQLYDLQEETGGFTAFIPWSFQPHNTALGGRHWDEATAVEYLKVLAISRLYLSNFLNVQSSWVTQGLKVCQMGLRFGGNDVGSVMLEENVVRAAGVTNCTTEEELRRIIRDAGFRPAQRDTLYRQYFLN